MNMPPDRPYEKVLVYDPARRPREWTGLLTGTQIAVFLSDFYSGHELDESGMRVTDEYESSCYVFADAKLAEQFCRGLVEQFSRTRCELFDGRGRAIEALAVVLHPSLQCKDKEDDPGRARLLILGALVLVPVGICLLYFDWTHDEQLIWPSLLAFNCFALSFRLVFWGTGILGRRKKKLKDQNVATG
jgi:hypothetical protein